MEQSCFSLEMAVRDYECDMQGIVNNAVYQHYLEHSRHEFLKSIGIDYAELTAQGINLFVTRVEIDYKLSLISGNRFVVEISLERVSPLRIGFRQHIYRLPDRKTVIRSLVTGAIMNAKGRPQVPKELDELLQRN